jgi:hypothetical protein
MKTTIKTITSKDFTKDGKTTTSITVTLANDVTGYLNDKGSSSDLKQGESVDYTLEVKQNKQGKDYNLLTLNRVSSSTQGEKAPQNAPQEAQNAFKTPSTEGVQSARTVDEMKFEGRKLCLKLSVSCFLAGKFEGITQVKEHFLDWVEAMDASIDDIKTT